MILHLKWKNWKALLHTHHLNRHLHLGKSFYQNQLHILFSYHHQKSQHYFCPCILFHNHSGVFQKVFFRDHLFFLGFG